MLIWRMVNTANLDSHNLGDTQNFVDLQKSGYMAQQASNINAFNGMHRRTVFIARYRWAGIYRRAASMGVWYL